MSETLANEFNEILPTLSQNEEIRSIFLRLVDSEPMPGKATEGGNRLEQMRQILRDLANNQVSLQNAFVRVRSDIPKSTSIHSTNNRVFPDGWDERLVRIQLSRFYNQAVMEKLLSEGATECYVPHSSSEESTSPCSSQLAGRNQNLSTLHSRLVDSYGEGNFSRDAKIPNHPHCTHVVTRAR